MYLGIDLGTGSLKAAVFDDDGSVVAAAEGAYEVPASATGRAEFDPDTWFDTCRRVVREATSGIGSAVRVIGLAGQMHGVVLVDGGGRPVRPAVLWPDDRATTVLDRFELFDAERPGILGNPLVPGMAGPILAWLADHEPASLARADAVVQPKDWLRMQLCRSQPMTDPSDASATLLYDLTADGWSDELCELARIPRDLLPPITDSSTIAGRLHPSVADDLGLGEVPVVVGCADAPAALLGAGIEGRGTALVNIGTGGQVMTPITVPAAGRRLAPGLHQYRSASTVTPWYAMAAIANAGITLGWVRTITGHGWDALYDTADSVFHDVGEDPVFVPFLTGERDPSHDGQQGGAWIGLTLGHDREALARSAVRGVALYLGLRARALMDVADVTTAVMSGGSTRNGGWVRALATVLGREVTVADDMHLTVRGAARLAARGVGSDLPAAASARTVTPAPEIAVDEHLDRFEKALLRQR